MRIQLFLIYFLLSCAILLDAQEFPLIEGVGVELEIAKKIAPDFTMIFADGNQGALSDYQGQVVYLSFWASWCKPCIHGFEKYREMRESMEALGVVMLNVSIDKSDEKWRAAINQYQPTGIHARVDQEEVRDAYQLYAVPLYEIVGKRGQFLYLSEEADRDILEDFRGFLEE